MKKEITFNDFCNEFFEAGREYQFSYHAKKLLFNYLEENNPEYCLDIIELCCNYTESTLEELKEDYRIEVNTLEEAKNLLEEKTIVVGITSDSIIFECF